MCAGCVFSVDEAERFFYNQRVLSACVSLNADVYRCACVQPSDFGAVA